MAVHKSATTLPGGWTPICNDCGVSLCWDISDADYRHRQAKWDGWKCRDCKSQTADLVSRLHAAANACVTKDDAIMREAADALITLDATLSSIANALKVTASVLEGEKKRGAGEPFSGFWSIPDCDFRGTVDDALNLASAALSPTADAAMKKDAHHG